MTARRSSRLPKLASLATAAVASAALLVTAGPATLAVADRLITGSDVADRSIGSKDLAPNAVRSTTIRKNAVQGSDIRNGTITAEDLHASLQGVLAPAGVAGPAGPAGATGPAGPTGPAGASGAAKPDGVATWAVHYEANGDTTFTRTSADTVPAGALIEPLAYTVDGDFSTCDAMFPSMVNFSLVPTGQSLLTAPTNGSSTFQNVTIVQTVSADPSSLKFTTSCTTGGMPGTPLPVPSFDASLTFQWTVRDTTPTRSFN